RVTESTEQVEKTVVFRRFILTQSVAIFQGIASRHCEDITPYLPPLWLTAVFRFIGPERPQTPNPLIVLFPLQWGKPSPSGDSSLPTGAAGDSGPQVSGRRVALEFFPCKHATAIIGNAINPADGRERLIVGRANFQRAIGAAEAQGCQNVLVTIEAMGINGDGFLGFHISTNISGDNIDVGLR